jgi:hypothetical protein
MNGHAQAMTGASANTSVTQTHGTQIQIRQELLMQADVRRRVRQLLLGSGFIIEYYLKHRPIPAGFSK